MHEHGEERRFLLLFFLITYEDIILVMGDIRSMRTPFQSLRKAEGMLRQLQFLSFSFFTVQIAHCGSVTLQDCT